MIAKKIIITASIFLLVCVVNIKAIQVVQQKIIAEKVNDWDMHWTKMVFDNSDNVLITMKGLFYIGDNLTNTRNLSEYCCDILGGYVKDSRFYVAINDIHKTNVYKIQNKIELESCIEPKISEYHDYDGVILVPEENYYYLFGHYTKVTFNPLESLERIAANGRVTSFKKPFLAKIENSKITRTIKLNYDSETEESYVIREAIAGKGSIHFFGFRNIDIPWMKDGHFPSTQVVDSGTNGYAYKTHQFDGGDYYQGRPIKQSIILHYSDYNLQKGKNTRNYTIYENIPGYDSTADTYSDYGVLSADSQDKNVYSVFTWVKWQRHHAGSTMVKYEGLKHKDGFNLSDVNSSIYFWQCDEKSYGKAEKIADGFCPLVRADQFGRVHIFYVDRNGNVIQKVRTNGKWSNEKIILNGVNAKPIIYTKYSYSVEDSERPEAILYTKFIAAEFDSENNLHIVYPTAEGIVYTKMKLE
ncbi:MAG: hypothetical protein LLF92_09605 [Planctomycetaceae bacterium]|nr:hypothetical protein [Planctomycetaceae bacterium]